MVEMHVWLASWLHTLGVVQKQEAGQDMIEYALLLGFIAVVTIAVIQGIGQDVSNILQTAAAAIP